MVQYFPMEGEKIGDEGANQCVLFILVQFEFGTGSANLSQVSLDEVGLLAAGGIGFDASQQAPV